MFKSKVDDSAGFSPLDFMFSMLSPLIVHNYIILPLRKYREIMQI